MKQLKNRYFLMFLFTMAVTIATAQQAYVTLKGHVINKETGAPVAGQTMIITVDSLFFPGNYNKLITDETGFYTYQIPYKPGTDPGVIFVYTYDCNGKVTKGTGIIIAGKPDVTIDFSICSKPAPGCVAAFKFMPTANNMLTFSFFDGSYGMPAITNIIRLWDFGDGTSSTEKNPVHTYTKPGLYNVCLHIRSSDSLCSSSFCLLVDAGSTIPAPCKNYFWFHNDSTGAVYTFEASFMNGQGNTWSWDFGDGTKATGQIVSHSFKGQNDTYKVCLTTTGSAVDGTVCTAYSCQEIHLSVPSPCESSFSFQPNSSGKGYTFRGWAKNSQITSWKWDFGDGTAATGETVSHSFISPGKMYKVCLTTAGVAANGTTCTYFSCQDVYIYIPSPCESSFWYQPDSSGNGYAFQGWAKNSRNTSWKWDFGDGTTATGAMVSHSFISPGKSYKVCLTTAGKSEDSIPCTYTSCQEVHSYIPSQCESSFTCKADSSGSGYTFQGWAKNSQITSWKWDFGDGTTATGQNVTHKFTGSRTSYKVCLTTSGSGAYGAACTSTSCQDIVIRTPLVCENYFKIYTADKFIYTFSGNVKQGIPANYYWDFGDGTTATGQVVTHAFGKIYTVFNVCLTTVVSIPGSTGFYECKSMSCQPVYNGVDTSMCKSIFSATPDASGNIFHFANLSLGKHNYTYWDFGDGSQSTETNPSHTYSSPGIFVACLTIGDNMANCKNQSCREIRVNMIQPDCKASFYAFVPDSVPSSLSYMFVNSSASGYTKQKWSFGDGTGSTEFNPVHTYASPGIYNVCLTIWDSTRNCQNTYCTNIFAGKIIGGHVISGIVMAGKTIADHGIVWLISPNNAYNAETLIDSAGAYFFRGVPSGSYYLYAMLTPGSQEFFSYMPTYYPGSLSWKGASVIFAGEPNVWYPISLVPSIQWSQGNAVINGNVNWVDAFGSEMSPAINVEIVLYNSLGVPVAYTFSEYDGTYNFDNLPYGEYTLQAEMAGKITRSAVVNLSPDSEITNINFVVDAAAISPLGTAGLNKPKLLAGNPYPNPAVETLNLDLNASASGRAEVEIIDIQGRILNRETIKIPGGKNRISVGTGFLTKGVYFLRIHSQGHEPVQRRFIK